MRSSFTYFENWIQKLLNCKVEKKNLTNLLNFSTTITSTFLFYLLDFDIINRISLHISSHSSMRYRRIFDIIAFMCKFITKLQLRSKIKQLKRWMQKLCYCKSWEIDLIAEFFSRQSNRLIYFIYWTLIYSKIIFWKIILERFCFNNNNNNFIAWLNNYNSSIMLIYNNQMSFR